MYTISDCHFEMDASVQPDAVAALREAAIAAAENAKAINAVARALKGPENVTGVHIGPTEEAEKTDEDTDNSFFNWFK